MSGTQSQRSNQDGATIGTFSVGAGRMSSHYGFTLTGMFTKTKKPASTSDLQERAGETEQSSETISQGTKDAIMKLVQKRRSERQSRKGDPEDGANSTFAPSTSVPRETPTAEPSVIKEVSFEGGDTLGDTPEGVATATATDADADAATDAAATDIYLKISKISNQLGVLISRMPNRTEPESVPPPTEAPPTEPPRTEHPPTEAPPTEPPRIEHPPTEPPRTEHPPTEPPPTEPSKKYHVADASSFMMHFFANNPESVNSLRMLKFGADDSMASFYRNKE